VNALAARLHAALPQTQCTRCGYPDCAGYARAVADGEVGINQCPPGGAEGVARLAAITGLPPLPLNPANGSEGPRALAVIDENWCIGCTLCLDACPTDAILGGNKQMHTVVEPYCTGCELCIPVCPVDCISLDNATGARTGWAAWSGALAAQALERYEFHSIRGKLDAGQQGNELDTADRRGVIETALARARARRDNG
jgi:electron transport complex protein RnfB